MAYPPISALPASPSRQDPANFADEADAFLGALPTFQGETNTAGTYIDGKAAQVETDSDAAAADAATASAAATAAQQAANAALWVTGTAYTVGINVFSPTDFLTYRSKSNFTSNTDPISDPTNWLLIASTALPLTGGTLTGALGGTAATFAGQVSAGNLTTSGTLNGGALTATSGDISGEFIADSYNDTYVTLTAAAAVTVNCETGNMFALTTSTGTTFTFSNPPANNTGYGFTLKLTAGGTHTITWPTTVDWADGTAPDAPATGTTSVLVFITHTGGTTWYGFQAGAAMA
tara:strand:+ start:934 stop:1806 length:873 start_codon:yes stop_codon:yes gene_type:complete